MSSSMARARRRPMRPLSQSSVGAAKERGQPPHQQKPRTFRTWATVAFISVRCAVLNVEGGGAGQ